MLFATHASRKRWQEVQNMLRQNSNEIPHPWSFFFQMELWKGNPGNLKPTEWGWKIVDGHMVAIQTALLPALTKLIQVFRCDCKTGCHTERCT